MSLMSLCSLQLTGATATCDLETVSEYYCVIQQTLLKSWAKVLQWANNFDNRLYLVWNVRINTFNVIHKDKALGNSPD